MTQFGHSTDTTFEDFDPNKLFGGKPLWAVYRDGRFKTYANRGHAINAFLSGWRTKLYKQHTAGWIRLAIKDGKNKPDRCEVCKTTDLGYRDGEFIFERERGKITDPLNLLFCCTDCKRDVARS